MVREVTVKMSLEACTAQEFYDMIYATDEVTCRYHRDVHLDDQVKVTPWEDNGRTIDCTMPVKLPETLKRVIGSDRIPIKDTQSIVFYGEDRFEVTSAPMLQIPGGSKFTTGAKVAVSNVENGEAGACEITVLVTCSAAGPWGMISLIEGVMAEQARLGMEGYLRFCKMVVREAKPYASEAASAMGSEVSDEFFDIQETLSEISQQDASLYSALGQIGSAGLGVENNMQNKFQKMLNLAEKNSRQLEDLSKKMEKLESTISNLKQPTYHGLYFLAGFSIAILAAYLRSARNKS